MSILDLELASAIPEHLVDRHRTAGRLAAREVDLQAVPRPLREGTVQVRGAEKNSSFRFNLIQEESHARLRRAFLSSALGRTRTILWVGASRRQHFGGDKQQIRVERMDAHCIGARRTELVLAIQV